MVKIRRNDRLRLNSAPKTFVGWSYCWTVCGRECSPMSLLTRWRQRWWECALKITLRSFVDKTTHTHTHTFSVSLDDSDVR